MEELNIQNEGGTTNSNSMESKCVHVYSVHFHPCILHHASFT